jgi:hypothetical protein
MLLPTAVNTGACTYCFIHAVETYGPRLSYKKLLEEMDKKIEGSLGTRGGGILGAVKGAATGLVKTPLRMNLNLTGLALVNAVSGGIKGYKEKGAQKPTISSNVQFDFDKPLAILP